MPRKMLEETNAIDFSLLDIRFTRIMLKKTDAMNLVLFDITIVLPKISMNQCSYSYLQGEENVREK
jgi:hypothetical protein